MSEYHRLFVKEGTYFFTLVTYDRKPLLCEEPGLIRLKAAFRYVMNKYPYRMDGLVILPDHLHCIWRLPKDDSNFSIRWNMLKRYFSIAMDSTTNKRREKMIWQRRFWEHLIRDEDELHRCLDYIHYNPVKHGYVEKPYDWDNSTFKQHVERGLYDMNWGCNSEADVIKNRLLHELNE